MRVWKSFAILLVATAGNLCAQPGTISTLLGAFPLGDGLPAPRASLTVLNSLSLDDEGRLLIGEADRIRRIERDGKMSTALGNGIFLFPPQLYTAPVTMEADDSIGVRRMVAAGTSPAVFGGAVPVFRCTPTEQVNSAVIYRLDPPSTITALMGGSPCTSRNLGDGGPAKAGYSPGVDFLMHDPATGDLYFSDSGSNRVRKIAADGTLQAVAGNGSPNADGDGGPAVRAGVRAPLGLAISPDRQLFIADFGNGRIRRVSAEGVIGTFAAFPSVRWVRVLKSGALLASDGFTIWLYSLADASRQRFYSGPDAKRGFIRDVIEDRDGSILVAHDLQVFRVNPDGSDGGLVAGADGAAGANGPQEYSRMIWPSKTYVDPDGNVWFSDFLGLRRQTSQRTIETVTTGLISYTVNSNQALYVLVANRLDKVVEGTRTTFVTADKFGNSSNLVDVNPGPKGSLLVTDRQNHRIWLVTPDGEAKSIAGNGRAASAGDLGPATDASLNEPSSAVAAQDGSIYITTRGAIRRVAPSGVISTVVGGTAACAPGEIVVASRFGFCNFLHVGIDRKGDVYFNTDGFSGAFEQSIYRLRGDNAYRVAGQGNRGLAGDGGQAPTALLYFPRGISFAPNGDLIFADLGNHRIRRIQGFSPFGFNPERVTFATSLNSAAQTERVQVTSADGEPRDFRARIEYPVGRQGWLRLSLTQGQVTGGAPANLDLTASPQGLPKGIYTARVIFTDPQSEEYTEFPVTMLISGTPQQLRLAQTGFTFVAAQGGPAPQPQQLTVRNAGTGVLPFTVAVSTLSGGAWLAATPPSGVADTVSQPRIAVSVNAAGLAPGVYFGLVTINATAADNAPQSAVVLLQVLGAGENPSPLVDPAGLIFTSNTVQSITLGNARSTPSTYTIAAPVFPDRRVWFQLPAASLTGSIPPGQTARVEIRPAITGIPPGQYRAQLSIRFAPDNVTRVVELLLVIANPNGTNAKINAVGNCKPTKLLPVFQQPGGGFSATAGWPQLVQLRIVDDCQDPLVKGRVRISFNNGDPAITLTAQPEGVWTGTWAPGRAVARIELSARSEGYEPDLLGTQVVAGGLRDDANRPRIVAGGVFSEASQKKADPVAIGSNITVQGARMAAAAATASPDEALPPRLGDTTVLVGGKPLGLSRAAEGEVRGLVPYSVADSTIHQIIVQRGASAYLQ